MLWISTAPRFPKRTTWIASRCPTSCPRGAAGGVGGRGASVLDQKQQVLMEGAVLTSDSVTSSHAASQMVTNCPQFFPKKTLLCWTRSLAFIVSSLLEGARMRAHAHTQHSRLCSRGRMAGEKRILKPKGVKGPQACHPPFLSSAQGLCLSPESSLLLSPGAAGLSWD